MAGTCRLSDAAEHLDWGSVVVQMILSLKNSLDGCAFRCGRGIARVLTRSLTIWTPTGSFTLTITSTSGGLAHSQQVALTVR